MHYPSSFWCSNYRSLLLFIVSINCYSIVNCIVEIVNVDIVIVKFVAALCSPNSDSI